jgi:IS5 family transposase
VCNDAQGKRHRKSRTHGRTQTPAEVALRLLILKPVRNWSYDTLEREVRANLVYRAFTRIGDEKVPDAKTLARLGQVIGPEVIGELHERLMELARERGVVQGRKMRVDTTVVETNVHYPTDSSLRFSPCLSTLLQLKWRCLRMNSILLVAIYWYFDN